MTGYGLLGASRAGDHLFPVLSLTGTAPTLRGYIYNPCEIRKKLDDPLVFLVAFNKGGYQSPKGKPALRCNITSYTQMPTRLIRGMSILSTQIRIWLIWNEDYWAALLGFPTQRNPRRLLLQWRLWFRRHRQALWWPCSDHRTRSLHQGPASYTFEYWAFIGNIPAKVKSLLSHALWMNSLLEHGTVHFWEIFHHASGK